MIRKGVSENSIQLLTWMLGCRLTENTQICNSEKYHTFSDFKDSKIVSTRLNKFCLITSNKTFTRGHRNRAVSYTHLDVYKRQPVSGRE